jgi:hypothetical protein
MQNQERKNNGNGKGNGRANGNGHANGNANGSDYQEKRRPADSFHVGRILVNIWPMNIGPVFRYKAEFRYFYGTGSTGDIPVQVFTDLRIATYKAAKRIRQLERLQHIPGWVRLVKMALGV